MENLSNNGNMCARRNKQLVSKNQKKNFFFSSFRKMFCDIKQIKTDKGYEQIKKKKIQTKQRNRNK